ncbi:MAG: hypothetical protein ACOC12_06925 [Bacteroidota bacterium]
MKTLTKLTIATLMIAMIIQTATATNFNTFRLQITEEHSVEVVTKVESLVEENLPVIHNMISKNNPLYNKKLKLPVKEEALVEEEIVTIPVAAKSSDDINFSSVIAALRAPEKEVDDIELDTKEIFENYQAENRFRLSAEEVSKLAREEQEVPEDESFYALMNSVSK